MYDRGSFNKKAFVIGISVTILIIALMMYHGCQVMHENNNSDTIRTTVKIYDTTWHRIDKAAPQIHSSQERLSQIIALDSVFKIDTQAVIRAFYTANYYEDTTRSDSNLFTRICDTVYKDKITWRRFEYQLRKPQTIINTTIISGEVLRRKVFAGVGLGTGFYSFFPGLGPSLLLLDKKDRGYQLGVIYNGSWSLNASLYWKISLRKKK